jgi:putative acetyltransferase
MRRKPPRALGRSSTGGLGVGTPRSPDLHTINLHSKDTFLIPNSRYLIKEVSQLEIREDDLTGKKIVDLLQEHLENMYEITPPGSVHALDLAALQSPEITFWTAWNGDELLGCGALKQLDPRTGEIKSMRTATPHRRKGYAANILQHIIREAERRAYNRLNLETGVFPEFAPARNLYIRHGFEYCSPFGEYIDDPNSVFMTKKIEDLPPSE